ncbi:MAG: sigma-70 family RNA polymerase sigma factor [Solirubrobacterales bacterium]|nr:sigma-70 family RNA polymerase sigma factor [Solirubrobacterales bacterium]
MAVTLTMEVVDATDSDDARIAPDEASRAWLDGLRSEGPRHDQCVRDLHALLLRTAHREVHRRRAWLGGASGPELDDVAHQAASDALLAIINNLDTYRGLSRFTTWSYRFVMNHVSVKTRQHLWSGRRVIFDDADWDRLPDRVVMSPHSYTEQRAQLHALRNAVDEELTARQREVFVSVALNEVPIDVVAARLDSNRGAIYKILFDARTKLRACLLEVGYPIEEATSRP